MILADTSVWIDHFRRGNARLAEQLEAGGVLCHPFVIGELACGMLKSRHEVLTLLGELPQARVLTDAEALAFIEHHRLAGRGLGLIDVHLLGSSRLEGAELFTLDRRLAQVALRHR